MTGRTPHIPALASAAPQLSRDWIALVAQTTKEPQCHRHRQCDTQANSTPTCNCWPGILCGIAENDGEDNFLSTERLRQYAHNLRPVLSTSTLLIDRLIPVDLKLLHLVQKCLVVDFQKGGGPLPVPMSRFKYGFDRLRFSL